MGAAAVTISAARGKITTRFFSVEANYIVGGLFAPAVKRVKEGDSAVRARLCRCTGSMRRRK
jgi:hypothetical protein